MRLDEVAECFYFFEKIEEEFSSKGFSNAYSDRDKYQQIIEDLHNSRLVSALSIENVQQKFYNFEVAICSCVYYLAQLQHIINRNNQASNRNAANAINELRNAIERECEAFLNSIEMYRITITFRHFWDQNLEVDFNNFNVRFFIQNINNFQDELIRIKAVNTYHI